MGAFRVGITVSNREGTRSRDVEALVDSGAFYSLLPSGNLDRNRHRTNKDENIQRRRWPHGRVAGRRGHG